MRGNGIKHIRCSPYHPASNGAVERFVRTFKQTMKANYQDGRTAQHRLESFLLTYRSTPPATTKEAPCVLFLGRNLCTRLDLLVPDIEGWVCEKQAVQKSHRDKCTRVRVFEVDQSVMVKNFQPGPTWINGKIFNSWLSMKATC